MTGQPAAQRPLDVVDLADAVQLVARQVQQHDHRRVDGVGDVRHVHLVDFQRRQLRVAGARQRGHQTGVHVGALGVGGDGPSVPSAAAVIRVVVDLPLVPVTTTVRRPRRAGAAPICPASSRPGRRSSRRRRGRSPATPSARPPRPPARYVHESVTIPGILGRRRAPATRGRHLTRMSDRRAILDVCEPRSWGRPAAEPGAGWAVVDVETSGFRPGQARIVSVAALALGDDGNVERSLSSLLNPGVDPGPTHVHGLTAEMLEGQPHSATSSAT